MRVLDPGHVYALTNIPADADHPADPRAEAFLIFVKRVGEKFPGNVHPPYAGTTIQEVTRVLIDRLQRLALQSQALGDVESIEDDRETIRLYRTAIFRLEQRAARRAGDPKRMLGVSIDTIESEPTCPTCGHIRCVERH